MKMCRAAYDRTKLPKIRYLIRIMIILAAVSVDGVIQYLIHGIFVAPNEIDQHAHHQSVNFDSVIVVQFVIFTWICRAILLRLAHVPLKVEQRIVH